jgi:hypothetical protein
MSVHRLFYDKEGHNFFFHRALCYPQDVALPWFPPQPDHRADSDPHLLRAGRAAAQ